MWLWLRGHVLCCKAKMHQYQIVGRAAPTNKNPTPKIYRMRSAASGLKMTELIEHVCFASLTFPAHQGSLLATWSWPSLAFGTS
jgi:hypothetical protein